MFEFLKDDWLEYKTSLQLCRHQQNNTESSWHFFTAHNLNRRKDKQHQEVMAGRGPSGGGVGGAQEDWRSALFPRLAGLRQQECFTDTRCQKSPFKNRTVGLYFHSANDISCWQWYFLKNCDGNNALSKKTKDYNQPNKFPWPSIPMSLDFLSSERSSLLYLGKLLFITTGLQGN